MSTRDINSKIAVVINKNGMGTAPEELAHTLIKNYLTIINSELKAIEEKGCKLVICKTCLIYNNLLESIKAGTIGTMLDIIDIQHNCTKIITL